MKYLVEMHTNRFDMKKIFLAILLLVTQLPLVAQEDTIRHEVLLETTKGNILLALYNDTPKHRDNFLKLTKEGFYNGVLFHRVIQNFMIQSGDSASRHAQPGQLLGDSKESYKIPAEILYPKLFHKRGALAAAREGNDVNPQRESSMSQFYIVYGKRFTDEMLDKVQARLDTTTHVKMPQEIREAYKKYGGTPHLDNEYTVFGEVLEGMDVVREIQWVDTDENDRPQEDVRILKATVVK